MSANTELYADAENQPSFEDALVELQQIVDQLESGSLGLEDSLRQYERGAALLRRCYGLLESAERRIEVLTGQTADGELTTAPFDATATHEPAASKAGRRPRTRASRPTEPEPRIEEADDRESLF